MKSILLSASKGCKLIMIIVLGFSSLLKGQDLFYIGSKYTWQTTIDNQLYTNFNNSNSNQILLGFSLNFNSQQDWDVFSENSAFMNFYSEYGPNGTNDVSLVVAFQETDGCNTSCNIGDTVSYCFCYFNGLGGSTIGDWSSHLPNGTKVLSYNMNGIGNIDSSIVWGESTTILYDFFTFQAAFPDHRRYFLPNPPELQSMQNLLSLRDTLNGNNNATVLWAIFDTTDHCPVDETRSGTFWLSNNGHDTITSAKIGIGWNGVIQDSILWTGSIPPYEHRTIHDFAGKIVHLDSLAGTVDIIVMEVNGQPDEEPGNNLWQSASNKATSINQNDLVFEWHTSVFTEDNYFYLVAEDGTKIWQLGDSLLLTTSSSGSLLSDTFATNSFYQFPIDIMGYENQCLQFNASHGLGGYFGESIRLLAGEQEIFNYSGWSTSFGGRKFYNGLPESTPTTDIVKPGLSIKPNPANQTVVLQANQLQAGELTWAAFNTLGQQVWAQSGQANGSNAEISFDVSNWPAGLYFVSVRDAKNVVTNRLMVQH